MGKDEDKGCFYRFIDDNYFAFYFRQWAAFFITVGILCIIAGIVVFFVLPQSKQAEITGNQLVKDENSKNYKYWKVNFFILFFLLFTQIHKTNSLYTYHLGKY